MQPAKLPDFSAICEPQALQEAFLKFSEASGRLELRYEALRKEAESLRAQLKVKEIEVKRTERLAVLGEMAAALAHEIRNPLGSLKLFLSLLTQEVSGNQNATELVVHMDKSINALELTVCNMLQFAKNRKLETAPLNLHALIQSEIETFKLSAKNIELKLCLEGRPFLSGNEQGLRQVFRNLLTNASQALHGSGLIAIETMSSERELLVRVKDNGPGFAQEVLPRLFDPFVSTKNDGTGLGLSIVKQVITQHGGQVSAHNADGAVIELKFPYRS
jgi:signal transduction histidine kinase